MDHSVSFGGEVNYEYLILGAGPAGLQMGHHLSRAGHSYLILEAGDAPGASFRKLPRHRTLLSNNKVHTGSTDPELNLRFDWNSLLDEDGNGELRFTRYSRDYFPAADDYVRYLCDYAEFYGLNVRCNTRILRFEKPHAGQFRLTDAEGGVYSCKRLIVATGVSFDDSIFAPECRPELVHDDRLPAQTPEWESVNVPGLYFAGTLMQANDYRQHASAFVHGFRYNVRALFRMLETRHHRRGWPAREIEPTPEGLVEATLARLNRGSGIWQQSGFLHDVIVVDEGWENAVYHEEMPLSYLHQSEIGGSGHYYTIALELGKIADDPFAVVRNPEPAQAEESVSLHPVIRRWSGRHLVSERHLLEDLFGEWKKPEAHVAPLRYFFMQQLLECADLEHGALDRLPGQGETVWPLLRAV